GPHGLVADKDGYIWYAGQQDGHLGKLDPKTGVVTKYKIPNPSAGGPHTPIFEQKGMLWFTMQQGNMVGRLTPATGEIKLVTMPTANSEPYGLVINSKGVPFFTQLMGNRIGSIDPVTMQVREYFLGEGTGPRRLAVMPDDMIYYTDYARGTLGRLDPATGRTREWTSPSGARSQPYAMPASGRTVWYVEGNAERGSTPWRNLPPFGRAPMPPCSSNRRRPGMQIAFRPGGYRPCHPLPHQRH